MDQRKLQARSEQALVVATLSTAMLVLACASLLSVVW
jgi:hypothetical protein